MPTPLTTPRVLITVDVEDWVQSTWDRTSPIGPDAGRNTERLLDILAASNVSAVMFVLGLFAERFPVLVQRMAAQGHEIASHGWGHIEVFHQAPSEFRMDVLRSKEILEDLTGKRVRAYRAPDFSILESTLWALDTLVELGFEFDSSIFPIKASRYGIPGWPPHAVRALLPSGGKIIEFPPSTVTYFGRHWPISGGGYHRLLSAWAIHHFINVSARTQNPVVCYCHPYELCPDELARKELAIPMWVRIHQGLGRGSFQRKLEMLSKDYTCASFGDLFNPNPPEYRPAIFKE